LEGKGGEGKDRGEHKGNGNRPEDVDARGKKGRASSIGREAEGKKFRRSEPRGRQILSGEVASLMKREGLKKEVRGLLEKKTGGGCRKRSLFSGGPPRKRKRTWPPNKQKEKGPAPDGRKESGSRSCRLEKELGTPLEKKEAKSRAEKSTFWGGTPRDVRCPKKGAKPRSIKRGGEKKRVKASVHRKKSERPRNKQREF